MKTGGWLGKIALVVLSVMVTMGLLNLAIIFGMYITHHDLMYRYDALLGWRVLPNLRGAHTPYLTYTDIHGFRILPGEPTDTQVYDVMMLGDSFCFGSWLSAQDTLTGYFKLAHPQLRIANAAVPGYGTDQELLALERYAPMLRDGGTIILFTYINDFDDIRDHWNEVRQKPWFEFGADRLVLKRPDSMINSFLWSARVFGMLAYAGSLAFNLEPAIYGDDNYAARLYRTLVERMAAIVRQRHGRLIVLYASGRAARSPAGRQWAKVVQDGAVRTGAAFISLDENTRALEARMFIDGDIHWNAAGNLANYTYLAPRIEPLLHNQ